ncbi:hypothetical protein [Arcobacter aquimarinus]|uniref:Uncharacterized protein n=1 Tax=Arcobacter aquimarinus TaxID=1315211 RepID=A0AAE7B540_9BACT|nr:hypothetical protein [Arcobacter aquimarinus]QKE26205.1 hypothetical protein AAQM_1458 [Arcobacter aquimarinus]RXI35796.1 hypothetical protein CP986_05290 [Arcobacter aquimarinus]
MLLECGFYGIDSEVKQRNGHKYFVARHRFDPIKVELIFVKVKELQGKKELCEFIENEKLIKG